MLSRRSHQHGIRKAKKYDRSELLGSKHQEKTNDIISLVHTYNPKNQNITPIIHQLNNILINGQSTKENLQRCETHYQQKSA